MRKMMLKGMVGGLPGLLVAVVPLLLHDLGIITSDQSQIGFVGVPILFIGVTVGLLVGRAETTSTGSVLIGITLGFLVGIGMAVAVRAMGLNLPLLWLFVAPATMIGGGAVAAWWAERSEKAPPPPKADIHSSPAH